LKDEKSSKNWRQRKDWKNGVTLLAAIPSDLWVTALAALSGVCFAGIGTAYKLGSSRSVSTCHILLGLCVVGMTACAPMSFPSQMHAPALIWILGVVAGLSQYVTIRLIGKGLALGSLSVVWCIVSLAFFPVIPYACFLFHKALDLPQWLGLLAAVACVLMASWGSKPQAPTSIDAAAGVKAPPHRRLLFLLVLASILMCNSICNVIQTHLAQTPVDSKSKYLEAYGAIWMFALYASAGTAALVDLAVRRRLAAPWKWMVALGAMGGLSSVSGIRLQNTVSMYPMSFAINGSVGIIVAAVLSVLFFKERISPAWHATIALGILAVVLGNLH
jgi:drug/metabolite transporter (DMT)-like permease